MHFVDDHYFGENESDRESSCMHIAPDGILENLWISPYAVKYGKNS
jgi:hypothetical protein